MKQNNTLLDLYINFYKENDTDDNVKLFNKINEEFTLLFMKHSGSIPNDILIEINKKMIDLVIIRNYNK